SMKARPGNRFEIWRYSVPSRVTQILGQMTAAETKRQSSVLKLTYEDTNPANAARMLNAIADAYLKQNLERRSEEADKSLKFLQEQLPELRKQLEVAEKAFNDFRNRGKTIDISGEIKVLLDKTTTLEKQRMEFEFKRKEMLQRYEPIHPVIRALDGQIASLKDESQGLGRDISVLPTTQQDYIRYARDVEVNNQLYVGLLNNAQQLQVARAGTTGNVAIIDRAVTPERPSRPNKPLTVAIGGLLGLLLGFLASQLMAMISGIVRDPKKLELKTGIQTYAILPMATEQTEFEEEDVQRPFLLAHEKPTAGVVEAMRNLRNALLFALSDTARAKVILITSAAPGQGKSFISVNLAYLMAAAGKRVLLIDADVRRSSLKRYIPMPEQLRGLSDVLKENTPYTELIRPEVFAHLDLLPAGSRVKNPGDLFSRQALGDTITSAAAQYDFVVIDSPPVLPVNDAAALSKWADVTVFVARQDAVSQTEVEQALSMLAKAGNSVSGLVFNGYVASSLRYGYGYGYGYGYRKYGGRYGKGYGKGYGYGGYGSHEDSEGSSKKSR
ncbi:MAG: polysaccharide biosynthesis tyrosine autokinase, partial [Rhodoferax sp.]